MTCARIKVHLVTACHAEAPSKAAQDSAVRGLWTVIQMGGACMGYGICVQSFGWVAWGNENTWKILA